VILAEADLVLREDHPARALTAELDLVEGAIEDGEERARKRDGDRRARFEVPRSADDLARIALSHVDLAHTEAIGVRMRVGRQHAADEEAAEVAVQVGHTDVENPLDLRGRSEESVGDLGRRHIDRDVFAEPGERDVHL
jgi:hypothetical protein